MISRNISFILIIIIPIGILFLLRSALKHKKLVVMCFTILVFAIMLLNSAFPIDNQIKSFKNPEDAVTYFDGKETKILSKQMGQDSCMFNTFKQRKYSFAFVKKDTNSWRYCTASSFKIIAKEVVDGINIVLYYVKGTDDYYLSVSHFGDKEIILVDSRLSKFEVYMDENISMYVGHINGMDKDYKLTINGKDINLGEG